MIVLRLAKYILWINTLTLYTCRFSPVIKNIRRNKAVIKFAFLNSFLFCRSNHIILTISFGENKVNHQVGLFFNPQVVEVFSGLQGFPRECWGLPPAGVFSHGTTPLPLGTRRWVAAWRAHRMGQGGQMQAVACRTSMYYRLQNTWQTVLYFYYIASYLKNSLP